MYVNIKNKNTGNNEVDCICIVNKKKLTKICNRKLLSKRLEIYTKYLFFRNV